MSCHISCHLKRFVHEFVYIYPHYEADTKLHHRYEMVIDYNDIPEPNCDPFYKKVEA